MKVKKNLALGGILLLGIGFAAVSTTLYLNGDVNISANSEDFDVRFTKAIIDSEDKTREAISEDGKTITYTTKELKSLNDKSNLDFEVTNNSSLYDAEVSIECVTGEKGEYYQITKDVASSIPSKTTDIGSVEVQKVKVTTEDIEEAFTCTLTAVAVERTTKGEAKPVVNKNIVNKDLECLKNKESGSCVPGTEIRYMVNNSEEKTFYVLHDDGDTMTLQQNENTIDEVAWNSTSQDNTKGPLTILPELEATTSGWSNVNTLNYEMGTTVFLDNAYTGCATDLTCTTNIYTLGSRSAKARMITVQEAASLNCMGDIDTCPTWMYSNLTSSGVSRSYWFMSAHNSLSTHAWRVSYLGDMGYSLITSTVGIGARAVIEVSK